MFRVGIGFDLHKLSEGIPLILGGVTIPFAQGLEGYSDADVLLHALMDAMLGGAGLRDIGYYFPPDDHRYRKISSRKLLSEVKKIIGDKHYSVVNADMVVIAQAPMLSPFIGDMKNNVASILDLSEGDVSIKATTTERLGVCGRGEAIAAQAAVLLRSNY